LYDNQQLADLIGVTQQRDAFQIGPHFGVALIAVFHPAQIAPIAFGVFQERDQAGHPDDVEGAGNSVAVQIRNSQSHMAAVAAAADQNLLRI
jgi:hypothetical protein